MLRGFLGPAFAVLTCAALLLGSISLRVAEAQTTASTFAQLASPGQCTVDLLLRGTESSVTLTLAGTFVGTVTISGLGADGVQKTTLGTTTAIGNTVAPTAGYSAVRACMTTFTSGLASTWLSISTNVTVNTAAPGPTVSPGLVLGAVIVCPSTAPAAVNGAYTCVHDSSGTLRVNIPSPTVTLPVTTPAPLATVATYLVPTTLIVCPSTAPAASNSTYIATCDSSGFPKVNIAAQALTPIVVTTPAPVATMFVVNTPGVTVQSYATYAPTPPAASVQATSIPTTGIATAAKSTAGVVIGATFTNSQAATAAYCGLYNATAPTLGTTVPLVYVYVPAVTTVPAYVPGTLGVTFGTAITAACATTYLGATGSAANTIFSSVFYY